MKRLITWFTIAAFITTQTAAVAGPHEEGVAAGQAANPVIKGTVNTPSASGVVPGYTTTPPERALYGKPNLAADANARLAACAATPTDPACEALRGAVKSANTAREVIGPNDPSVAAASSIARNPSTQLGSLASYYSGCTTTEVTIPAGTKTRSCTRYMGIGNYSCSKTLTVGIERSTSCTPGEWFAHAGSGAAGLDAQCLPDRPDTAQHFRVTNGGVPVSFFDTDMTKTVTFPEVAGVVRTYYTMYGNTINTSVYVANKSCTTSTCTLTALIADDMRENCTWSGDSGPLCTFDLPFLKTFAACPAGTQQGDLIQNTVTDGDSSTTTSLSADTCYAPSPSGSLRGIDVTGRVPGDAWNIAAPRPVTGWSINPAYGSIPSMTLTYPKPKSLATSTERWDDQCPSLEAGGRCTATTAPRCVDGPATKVIDGISVTKDCWEYQSTMSCASASAPDQCAPLAAAGCTASGSTCKQTNPTTGLCEIYQDDYSCPTPAETVTTASSCPTSVFCLGASCFNIGYINDRDFARSMSMMEAGREAGVYLDTDRMQVFKGEPNTCRDRLLKNCCYSDGAGAGMTNQSMFGVGSRLVYDVLMNAGNREFIYQGLSAMLTGAGFSGSFSSYGITVAVNGTALPAGSTVLYASTETAGSGVVVAFDPWSLAIAVVIYIVLSMASCNADEGKLAMKQGAGLCHEIGTWCSSRVPIVRTCIEHTTSKCCFNSRLARIVNEQGRVQLGKGWGSPEGPDCSGFTIAQLQTLNFAAMDLSEFYASIVPKAPNATAIEGSNSSRVPACYFGQGKC